MFFSIIQIEKKHSVLISISDDSCMLFFNVWCEIESTWQACLLTAPLCMLLFDSTDFTTKNNHHLTRK